MSEKLLNALGISSCSHFGPKMALLSLLFSETAWHHFLQVSLGLGSAFIPRYFTACSTKLNRMPECKSPFLQRFKTTSAYI